MDIIDEPKVPPGYHYMVPRDQQISVRIPLDLYRAFNQYKKRKGYRSMVEAISRAGSLGMLYDLRNDYPDLEPLRELQKLFVENWEKLHGPFPESFKKLPSWMNREHRKQ